MSNRLLPHKNLNTSLKGKMNDKRLFHGTPFSYTTKKNVKSNSICQSKIKKVKNLNTKKENLLMEEYNKLKHIIFLMDKKEKENANIELIKERKQDFNFSNLKRILRELFPLKSKDPTNPFNYNLNQKRYNLDTMTKNIKRNRINEVLKRIVLHFKKIEGRVKNDYEKGTDQSPEFAKKFNREKSAKLAEKNMKDIIKEISNKKKKLLIRNYKFNKNKYIYSNLNNQIKCYKNLDEYKLNNSQNDYYDNNNENILFSPKLAKSISNSIFQINNYNASKSNQNMSIEKKRRPLSCNNNYYKNKKLLLKNKSFILRKSAIKVKNLPLFTTKIGDLVKEYDRIRNNSKKLLIDYKENHFSTYEEIEKIIQVKEDMLMNSLKEKFFHSVFPKNNNTSSKNKMDFISKLKYYIEYIEDTPGKLQVNDNSENLSPQP